jgi:hypothetical protein
MVYGLNSPAQRQRFSCGRSGQRCNFISRQDKRQKYNCRERSEPRLPLATTFQKTWPPAASVELGSARQNFEAPTTMQGLPPALSCDDWSNASQVDATAAYPHQKAYPIANVYTSAHPEGRDPLHGTEFPDPVHCHAGSAMTAAIPAEPRRRTPLSQRISQPTSTCPHQTGVVK